ncbi:amidohydrolase family protein [Agromyces italicus]|uniref:amidohydrolase family protein n=1 Tax=Agromyces italicus TaxID=279572 RepID=UPI0003B3F18F|nr:amidohydrolase family protein [Agromyces italicus]
MIADLVVVGRSIHPGAAAAGPGFVAVAGNRIIAVDTTDASPDAFIGARTDVVDARAATVVAGLHDNHVFFTSQLLEHGGLDVATLSDEEVGAAARTATSAGRSLAVRGVDAARAVTLVAAAEDENVYCDLVAIAHERTAIVATRAATQRLGELDPGSNESLHALYAQLADDEGAVQAAFAAAAERMHRGGVVSVKDIAFDTHLGMLPAIDRMLTNGTLALRYAFASQAVAAVPDLDAGAAWAGRPGARFHGYKLMTDGSFDELTAELLPPDDRWRRAQHAEVDYEALATQAQRVLAAGFRLALNADGDGAARACIEVFEDFAQHGTLPAGCSLSDASLVDAIDAGRLGRLGIGVETYPQLLRYPGYDRALMEELLGAHRGERLGNFAAMLASGVAVTAGTDFPLFNPSLPEAMLSASERVLGDGDVAARWVTGNAVSRDAVVAMWTTVAARAMGQPGEWGVLAPGAAADLVVYDRELLHARPEELLDAVPALVLADGRVVHAA